MLTDEQETELRKGLEMRLNSATRAVANSDIEHHKGALRAYQGVLRLLDRITTSGDAEPQQPSNRSSGRKPQAARRESR